MPSLDNVKIANKFSGSNIGDKINNAINAFNGASGEVWVFSEAVVNNITVDIEVKPNITLKFHTGLYKMAEARKIWMWDNTHLTGTGHDAIIQEPLVPWSVKGNPTRVTELRFVYTNASRLTSGNNGSAASYNIHVSNLQFLGNRENVTTQDVASITLGNCHNGGIRNCYFNETSGYAAGLGTSSGHNHPGEGAEVNSDERRKLVTEKYKEYGENLYFDNNIVEGVPTQNLAIFTVQNLSIQNNKFIRASKKPYKILNAVSNGTGQATLTFAEKFNYYHYAGIARAYFLVGMVGGSWAEMNGWSGQAPVSFDDVGRLTMTINTKQAKNYGTYTQNSGGLVAHMENGAVIDFEPNNGYFCERINRFTIANNLIDLTESARFVGAIGIQAVSYIDFTGGVITNNVIRAHNTVLGNAFTGGVMTEGIYLGIGGAWDRSSAKGIVISNNSIEGAAGYGIYLDRLDGGATVTGNHIENCGWNGGAAMVIWNTNDCIVQNNTIKSPVRGHSNIMFKQVCTGNTISNNTIGDRNSASVQGIEFLPHTDPDTGIVYQSVATKNKFLNNTIAEHTGVSKIAEGVQDGDNLYIGNITKPGGISIRAGGNSKIGLHYYTDGTVEIPGFEGGTTAPPDGGGGTDDGGGGAADAAWKTGILYDIDAGLVTTAVSSNVATIPSRINGGSFSATQTDTSLQAPLRASRIGARRSVQLPASYAGYEIPVTGLSSTTPMTIAFVGRQPANPDRNGATGTMRLITGEHGANKIYSINGKYGCLNVNDIESVVRLNTTDLAVNTGVLMIAEFDAAGIRYYRGSTLLGSVATDGRTYKPSRVRIGLNEHSEGANGDVARLIVWARIMSSAEKTQFISDMTSYYTLT